MPKEAGPAFIRGSFAFPVPLTGVLGTAGAVTLVDGFNPGFVLSIEKIVFIPEVTGAGAGATQALQVRKGAAAGTVLATATVTLANHILAAAGISGSVAAADNSISRLADADTFSITKAAGTVFTTAGGTLLVFYRTRPQARI